jgi:hypothetical protein
VKNSNSNLVTDNIRALTGKYNSDLHWAYHYLNPCQRTSFFTYRDKNNPDNAKVFCYIKIFDVSPQRVEFHVDTFRRYEHRIPELMELISYLIVVQGTTVNPQVRPIAIAEAYARETLKLVDIHRLMREAGIVPTMNEARFGKGI